MYTRERIKAIRLMELVKANPSYLKELNVNLSMKRVNSNTKRSLI